MRYFCLFVVLFYFSYYSVCNFLVCLLKFFSLILADIMFTNGFIVN